MDWVHWLLDYLPAEWVAVIAVIVEVVGSRFGRPNLASIAAAVLSASVSIFVERRYHQNPIVLSLLTLLTAGIATYFSIAYLADAQNNTQHPWTVIAVFLASVLLWSVFFHVASANYGKYLSTKRVGILTVIFRNWVRSINYVYLSLSTVSILRIVVSAVELNGQAYFNAVASVLLGFAVH